MGKKGKQPSRLASPSHVTTRWRFYAIALVVVILSMIIWFSTGNTAESADSRKVETRKEATRKQYKKDNFNFSEGSLKWMLSTKDPEMVFIAARSYHEKGEIEKAINAYEEVVFNLHENANAVLYDGAVQRCALLHQSLNYGEQMIKVLLTGIANRKHDDGLHTMYGLVIGTLFSYNQHHKGGELAYECIEYFTANLSEIPYHCYQQAATYELYENNIEKAIPMLNVPYTEDSLKSWRDENGKLCPAIAIPFTLETDPNQRSIRDKLLISSDITQDIDLSAYNEPCSVQQWPLAVIDGVETDVQTESWEMGCFEKEKVAVIHKLTDVMLIGSFKIIFQRVSENQCYIYVHGTPHTNSKAHPYVAIGNTPEPAANETHFQVPIKRVKSALILHFLDENYYHFSVEGLSKILIALKHPVLSKDKDLRVLMPLQAFSTTMLGRLDLLHLIEPFEPDRYRYHIDTLYTIDWRFSEKPERPMRHFDDYYVPPMSVVRMTRETLRNAVIENMGPRNVLLYQHRARNRNLLNPQPLYDLLYKVATDHGMEFKLHGFVEQSLEEQAELFSRAVVVMGVHGAGFTNILYCQDDTAIIELPTTPTFPYEYNRIASILHFPYYSVPSADFFFYGSKRDLSEKELFDIKQTLEIILPKHGFTSNKN